MILLIIYEECLLLPSTTYILRRFFIARDIFGIKPLFYTIVKNELVFASEIKALFEYPGVEKNLTSSAFQAI